MLKKRTHLILTLLAITLLLAACGKPTKTPVQAEPTLPVVSEAAPTAEPTQSPTETPVVILDAALVLWAPESVNPDLALQLENGLKAYADANGLSFTRTPSLSAAQVTDRVKVVVSAASAGEVQSLAAVLPQAQFLAVNAENLVPTENLSVLNADGATRDQLSFLAGYVLALGTADFRVGVLSQAGTPEGQTTRDAFVTGARYHCGLCNSRFVPVEYYPFTAEINDPANPVDWQAAADALLAKAVTGIFVQPEISTPELIAYLNSKNVTLIGVEGQPELASIQKLMGVLSSGLKMDPALDQLFLGESVGAVRAGIELKQVNRDLFSDGRAILFERIKQEMLDGYIKTLP